MTDKFRTGSVRAGGIQFSYLEAGDGPLVLCLHGFPDCADTFCHLLPALADAGYRAIAPYMRGYAPTDVPDGSYQTAILATDVVELIDKLGDSSAIVIGHDWGAAVAYGSAKLAPEKITKMITLAVPHPALLFSSLVTNPEQQRRSWYMFFFQMSFADDAMALNDFKFIERIVQEWSPQWQCPSKTMNAIKNTFRQPGVTKAALDYYRCLFNPKLHDEALFDIQASLFNPPIEVPTIYFHGERDGCIGLELTESMDQFFVKGFEKIVISDAGHWVHLEQPEEVNRRIIKFLTT
ncbi:MAG TPA: alpha/beta hydrolase [Nitrosomonas nitrosa]|uniref:alpha/beta fold hydrolase n=1 Tax=Nitrosomonas sp. TaxID=42353 RepID=UPI002085EFDF|nr:alpha/beta hydrolase [Nitrosomonas sp.]GJL75744.1 MAG: epoxide hydrolase [Nitrosomonas sp.]HNP52870.1 alpha/beta hydrolase [Nitrosomonas nitrosa]